MYCYQVVQERDAFIQENQAIAELLLEEGLQQFAGSTPKQPVEHLLQRRNELNTRIEQLESEKAHLAKELSDAAATLQKERVENSKANSAVVDRSLEAAKKAHEAERVSLVKERDQYKSECETNQQKLSLLQSEMKSLKNKMATEGRSHDSAMAKLRNELEGNYQCPSLLACGEKIVHTQS